MGQPAIGLTDHGNMHGAIEFYDKAMKAGIKLLQARKFPVVAKEIFGELPDVTDMDDFVRWIDTLDRF